MERKITGQSSLGRWSGSTKSQVQQVWGRERKSVGLECGEGGRETGLQRKFAGQSMQIILRTVFTLGIGKLSNGFQQRSD